MVTVYPDGTAVPRASTLNYSAHRIVPNAVLAKVGAGTFLVRNAGPPVQLVVDAVGYFSAS